MSAARPATAADLGAVAALRRRSDVARFGAPQTDERGTAEAFARVRDLAVDPRLVFDGVRPVGAALRFSTETTLTVAPDADAVTVPPVHRRVAEHLGRRPLHRRADGAGVSRPARRRRRRRPHVQRRHGLDRPAGRRRGRTRPRSRRRAAGRVPSAAPGGRGRARVMATDRGAVRPYLAGGRGVRPEYRFPTPPLRAGHDAVQQPGTEPRRVGVHRFEDVVAAELAGLLRYATALSGDPHQAHDLVQEVLARAYTRWSTVGATERPSAYLMTMVTNEFVSWRRRWHTRSVLTLGTETLERAAPAGRDHSESIVDRDDLERRLSQLPRRQQAALVLRFFEGLDYAETAAILGCAEGTVRSACSRGLAALRLEAASGAPPQRASAALTPTENP